MPLTVIHASAGSGKTYRLAVAYISLLLEAERIGQPLNPASILATTFTRAAAGEILDRILKMLAQAALHEPQRRELSAAIHNDPATIHNDPTTESELPAALCQQALERLALQLDRLCVSTMDAFFGQIATAFAPELGLPPGWRMTADEGEEELRRTALHALIEATDPERLVDALAIFQRQKTRRSVQEALARFSGLFEQVAVAQATGAFFAHTAPQVWNEAETAAARRLLAQWETWAPQTKAGEPDKRWKEAAAKLARALAPGARVGDLFAAAPLAGNLLGGRPYYGQEVPEALRMGLQPHLAAARAAIRQRHRARAEAAVWLAAQYQRARQAALFDEAACTFGDITRCVGRYSLGGGGLCDDLYFRLGTRFQHVLFDEFQDTSRQQFDFFRPLLEEIGGSGGSITIVGDEKQAIYGWRGGERELMRGPLKALGERIGEQPAPSLHLSYRSSRAVLEAVNAVFGTLKTSWLPGDSRDREKARLLTAAGRDWAENFAPHSPAERVAQLPGETRLFNVDDENAAQEFPDGGMECVVERVREHLARGRKVAILLRKHKRIAPLILALREALPGVEISGEGGNPLTDSRAVEWLLSLFLWLDHPGHTAARFHLLSHPACGAFGFPYPALEADGKPVPAAWEALAATQKTLTAEGLANALRRWIRHPEFARHCAEPDRLRCEQLLEVAREYERRPAARWGRFVEHVRQRRVERRGGSRVRVMTIHAAKGLEFEAVVLALLDSRKGGFPQPVLREHGGEMKIVPSPSEADLLGLAELTEQETRKDFEEELSVLYVGMTRACSWLDILLEAKDNAPIPQLLRAGLGEGLKSGAFVAKPPEQATARVSHETTSANDKAKEPRSLTECGTARVSLGRASANDGASKQRSPMECGMEDDTSLGTLISSPSRPLLPADWQRAVYTTPSGQEDDGAMSVASLLAPGNRASMRFGELVHAWLSAVSWLEDGLPAPDDLLAASEPLWAHLSRKEAASLAMQLMAQIATPGTPLHDVFTRANFSMLAADSKGNNANRAGNNANRTDNNNADNASHPLAVPDEISLPPQLWRERRFAVLDSSSLVTGSFDRVVLLPGADGQPRAAHIIDFKTDRVHTEEERREKEARYAPQLAAYRQSLARLLPALRSERITTRLCFIPPLV